MYAEDFVYDGTSLSSLGYVICNFGGSQDLQTVSAGSVITFNTVSRHRGKINSLTGTQYDQCIETSFQICKNPCENTDLTITDSEYRSLMRWLNRHQFLQFNFVYDDGRDTCYYDASFNINKILSDDRLYGLELSMQTNRPFGYGQEVSVTQTISGGSGGSLTVNDYSDEIGYTYPDITITLSASGDLTVKNTTLNSTMVVKNCASGEVITINGSAMTITTSSTSHHYFYNDFNYEFLKIGNSYPDIRSNTITVSLPCTIQLSYKPIIKNAPE